MLDALSPTRMVSPDGENATLKMLLPNPVGFEYFVPNPEVVQGYAYTLARTPPATAMSEPDGEKATPLQSVGGSDTGSETFVPKPLTDQGYAVMNGVVA